MRDTRTGEEAEVAGGGQLRGAVAARARAHHAQVVPHETRRELARCAKVDQRHHPRFLVVQKVPPVGVRLHEPPHEQLLRAPLWSVSYNNPVEFVLSVSPKLVQKIVNISLYQEV